MSETTELPPAQASEAESGGGETSAESQSEAEGEQIDLQALAERVYRLLKKEARLERERLG